MDLSDINVTADADDGAWMELAHPQTGKMLTVGDGIDAKPVRLRVLGADSTAVKAEADRYQAWVRNNPKHSIAAREDEARKMVSKAVIGWENLIYDGEPLQYSPEAVARLLQAQPWIAEQIDRFIADRANFFRG